jgi:hypothetical protein
MAKFARCPFAKTTANCFNSFCHFHLISSISRSQRSLIYDCIYFCFPTPLPRRQHFRKHFLGALFIPKVPFQTGAPPPQLFDASYAPGLCNRTCLARCSENGVYCITWPYNPRAKTFTCITVPMAMNTPRSTNLKAHLKRSASRRLGSAVT